MAAAAAVLAASLAAGQNIKMATLSPEGSPWDNIFKKMGKSWQDNTAGRVSLTVIAGGAAGDETDIVRKLRVGSYQAGAISVAGLVDIDKAFTIFEVPLFFGSYDEMTHVLDKLTPTLTARLEAGGFKLIAWGYVGWVHFFSNQPVRTLAELRKLKMMTLSGDETLLRWWRTNGFKPVSLATTDIMMGLETGMIDAITVPPLFALQTQYYKRAKYMADIGLAPLMGAVVMSQRAWDKIAEADRAAILAAGQEAEKLVFAQVPTLDEGAVRLMASAGLEVIKVKDTPTFQEWVKAGTEFADTMRGSIVPVPIFDEALAARAAYRKSLEGSSP